MSLSACSNNGVGNPVLLVPWDEDFLAALTKIILEKSDGDLSRVMVVFPHRRPRRYLLDRLAKERSLEKPCLMPEIFSIREFIKKLRMIMEPESMLNETGLLDQVGLLRDCLEELSSQSNSMLAKVSLRREDIFFPWGVRLASLLEELFLQGVEPDNLLVEDEAIADFAISILSELGAIYRLYRKKMADKAFSTAGLDSFWAFSNTGGMELLFKDKILILAGFHAPVKTEEELFHYLWRVCGATVVLSGDPAMARTGAQAHFACAMHTAMLKRWHAAIELKSFGRKLPALKISYYECFDLHSQLKALARDLKERSELSARDDSTSGIGIILPDTSMLMPVLHHLPVKEVNISMGYPFKTSSLAQLFDILFKLQKGALSDGTRKYYWRDLIALLRHPYLRILEINEEKLLRHVFHLLEEAIRKGGRFVNLRDWRDDAALSAAVYKALARSGRESSFDAARSEKTTALLDKVLFQTLSAFEHVDTLYGLSAALEDLAMTLLENGGDLWEKFPIDGECLYRLLHDIIPSLRNNSLSKRSFPPLVLFEIFRQLMEDERTPFEADPLTALQIVGFLESRLLSFNVLYLLGATDERLPGRVTPDPLLPDPLRSMLGLPDSRRREQISAYNFFNLLHGSGEAVILYESGDSSSGLDHSGQRSRFIEELLWQEEQRQKKLLKPGMNPLQAVNYSYTSPAASPPCIPKTPEIKNLIRRRYGGKPLSLSALDSFLRCPVAFYYERLVGLKPLSEVSEEEEASDVGRAAHMALYSFMGLRRNQPFYPGAADRGELAARYREHLRADGNWRQLPLASRLLIERAGIERLLAYLDNMPDTTVQEVELELRAEMALDDMVFGLLGRVDRVDRREHGALILDYKTGVLPKSAKSFWKEASWWDRIAETDPGSEAGMALFFEISGQLGTLQLPGYIWLYGQVFAETPWDAAFVDLGHGGREESLLGVRVGKELRHEILTGRIPALIRFILRQLLEAPFFPANHGRHCRYCSYGEVCRI